MKENINYQYIHFIGIGGVSMSGIAHILLKWGYKISGSDRVTSEMTDSLKEAGAEIFIGQDEKNITNQDLVIYTAAIPQDNPEMLKAKQLGIKMMERAEFLGELTKLYSKTVAISGTHGKTTTTSIISMCFIQANLDPSIQVGTVLPAINGNFRVGSSDYFIIEACEYVDSFLRFLPETEIILNIEAEHLDYFKDMEHIRNSFNTFVNILPKDGNLIICIDNAECKALLEKCRKDINIYTYSINDESADIYGYNIKYNDNGCGIFDVKLKGKTIMTDVTLSVPGIHNISNACACIATCIAHNISYENIKEGLFNFKGSQRRFEYKGDNAIGAHIYDDYAHHPTEIKALLQAANKCNHHELWGIFQPHTFSRLKTLFEDFINCFNTLDHLIVTDVYAAREIDDGTISSEMLVDAINEKYPNKAIYISDFDEIASYINSNTQKDDLILTIGAGTVTKIGPKIIGG